MTVGKGDRNVVRLTGSLAAVREIFFFPPESLQIPKLHFLSLSKGSLKCGNISFL